MKISQIIGLSITFMHILSILTCRTASPKVEIAENSTATAEKMAPVKVKSTYKLEAVMELPEVLHECSGMEKLGDDELVALNDSGGKPHLYIFNEKDNKQVRTVKVMNVKNNDWEELAADDDFIYIGDFGNNGGTRQDLRIYKISKKDLVEKKEVTPEIISFRYEGQTKYNDSNRHNFDCEAMISKGDSLYLFSKNRGDFRTDLYGLPKVPGDYVVSIMGSFDSDGLVTGADYRKNDSQGELVLVGYAVHGKALYPFILYNADVSESRFLDGDIQRIKFDKVLQTETIIFHGGNSVFLTNEEEDGSNGMIYKVEL